MRMKDMNHNNFFFLTNGDIVYRSKQILL